MPDKQLEQHNQQLKKRIRRNSLGTGILALGSAFIAIGALSGVGSRFDMQEFCFKPPKANHPEEWCTPEKRYKGIAWRVALEADLHPEFERKTYFTRYLPAKRPDSGLYALLSAGMMLSAYLYWQLGTNALTENVHKVIRQKEEEFLEDALALEKHSVLSENKTKLQTERILKIQEIDHSLQMQELLGEEELASYQQQVEKQKEKQDKLHTLQVTQLEANTAELRHKRAKELLEAKKLEAKLGGDLWQDNSDSKETSLEELLKEHEDGWLWSLVKGISPIIIYGKAGSYKSYTAACIALCKVVVKKATIESIADPDYLQNKDAAWKHIRKHTDKAFGEFGDWENYGLGIETAFERWKTRTQESPIVLSIWDELTLMGSELGELAKQFMPKIIATPRKRNEEPILITHSVTTKGLGGVEGMSDAIKEGCYRLKLKCDSLGKPLFKGYLYGWIDSSGNEIEEKEITLPDWFRPEKLAKYTEKNGDK